MPSTSFENEERTRREIRTFFYSVWKHWESWVATCLGIGGVALYQALGGTIYPWVLWGVATGGVGYGCFRAWQDQFRRTEELENNLLPRLETHCTESMPGCVERSGFKHAATIVFRIVVESLSDLDVEECSATLLTITHAGQVLSKDRNATLTFQPSENVDSQRKTIRPRSKENIDVIFVALSDETVLEVLPGTKGNVWHGYPQFSQLFNSPGEYQLEMRIEAKNMQPLLRKLKFVLDGTKSTMECI